MTEKQLVIMADMEGASGIFERNREALFHEELFPQKTLWRSYGRSCLTSDVLAVCKAAADFGIRDILLCDMHFAGCAEYNVQRDKLPANVRLFDTPDRELHWSRIRGQAAWEPFGIITVGQHARNREPDAYFPHTIHTPPIEAFYIDGIHAAEIGQAVMSFHGTPYLANIGCAASHREARELSPQVSCISVKDKARDWEPSPQETFPLVYEGVLDALRDHHEKTAFCFANETNIHCELHLSEGYAFNAPKEYPWLGGFSTQKAYWSAPDIQTALALFWRVHDHIRKVH